MVAATFATMKTTNVSGARARLRQLSQELFAQYPDFYYVYLDLFKYEVEEEFTDTTLYGGNS